MHLGGGAFEQAAASGGHQAVAGEGQRRRGHVKGDMAHGVAGDGEGVDGVGAEGEAGLIRQRAVERGEAVGICGGPRDARVGGGAQGGDALDVIGVVVGLLPAIRGMRLNSVDALAGR